MNVPKRVAVAGAALLITAMGGAVQAQPRPSTPATPANFPKGTFPALPKNARAATIPAKPELAELHLPATARHIACADAAPWMPAEWKVPIDDPRVQRYCWVDDQNQVHVIMSTD
jgi:hypothetical protein